MHIFVNQQHAADAVDRIRAVFNPECYKAFKALLIKHTLSISFTYLMSSSWAKMMTPRALGVSISLLMILSNSPGLGSRGIFID